jgi:hypothetical protein
MPFSSQDDAKRFFVDRVLARAAQEGLEVSPAELFALRFSAADEKVDEDLLRAFDRDCDMAEFEEKIVGLLGRALAADREVPGSEARWREAYAVLKGGDHYLLVMLARVLGGWLGRILAHLQRPIVLD